MKKFVLKLDLPDDKAKQKAMRTVAALSGIDLISMDMKGKKLTVIGTVDPVSVVSKLRKYWPTSIISVGLWPEKKEEPKKEEPKKEEEKKEEPKKEEEKKEEPKKEEGKKEEGKKEEEKKEDKKEEKKDEKKEEEKKAAPALAPAPFPDPILEMPKGYRPYNPYMTTYNPYMTTYYVQSMEENPNACVIF